MAISSPRSHFRRPAIRRRLVSPRPAPAVRTWRSARPVDKFILHLAGSSRPVTAAGLGLRPSASRLEVGPMRQCPNCGFQSEGGLSCQLCGHRLPLLWGVNDLTIRRIGITLLVPVLVWILMTRVLGV